MICPHCHNQTPEGETCVHCGAALHDADIGRMETQDQVMDNDSLRCPYCGAALWEDAAFCPRIWRRTFSRILSYRLASFVWPSRWAVLATSVTEYR